MKKCVVKWIVQAFVISLGSSKDTEVRLAKLVKGCIVGFGGLVCFWFFFCAAAD